MPMLTRRTVCFTGCAVLLVTGSALFGFAPGSDESALTQREQKLADLADKLRPLHQPLGKPKPGEWLSAHAEPGQTFAEYVRERPVTPQGRRRVIYILPLGDFTPTQKKIVTATADFLGRYYDRPVRVQEPLALSVIPKKARRKHPQWGDQQVLSTYVLNDVLKPRLPKDAAALIALSTADLWPGRGWNFVFGQASLRDRVGVWSIYRNGDPEKSKEGFRICLRRTLKTASHEVGHMFSMRHCTRYECNMCGSNHRAESDRRPLAACPECVAKLWWATGADPARRYDRLAKFAQTHGLTEEERIYKKSAAALRP